MSAWAEVFEWVRFFIGGGLLLMGLATFMIEIIGVFRFKYVLNRMHAAAMGDTLGLGFTLIGLIIMSGLNFTSLKLFLVIVFLWFSSPVSSHLIARLEVATDEEREKHYRVAALDDSESERASEGIESGTSGAVPLESAEANCFEEEEAGQRSAETESREKISDGRDNR